MNISYLIQILQNKITILNNGKIQAFLNGDIELVSSIEKELLDTQNTFSQLTMLQEMTLAAETSNKTPAELLTDALNTAQNTIPIVQGPSASAIINGYDISAYATDPLHEQKIQTIMNGMPGMALSGDIDNYIQNNAFGSPVSGDMVLKAVTEYGVDLYLLLAIMQNDSGFGLLGVGARTNNPGNVGNTGYQEQLYPSWEEGVRAVAGWLDRHRIQKIIPVEAPATPPPIVKEEKIEKEVEETPEEITEEPIPEEIIEEVPVEEPVIEVIPTEPEPEVIIEEIVPEIPGTIIEEIPVEPAIDPIVSGVKKKRRIS